MKRVAVIGSGFAGIAAASCLARRGYDVTVYEKNATLGGRAQLWEKEVFRFALGPSCCLLYPPDHADDLPRLIAVGLLPI